MHTRMTLVVRAELANAIRRRTATSMVKRKMLDEFVAATGYHEKSAIRVLNGQPVLELWIIIILSEIIKVSTTN